jgi:hypothetical protein
MYPTYLPKYNARIAVPAAVEMTMNVTHTGLDYSAVITVTKLGTLAAASFKLHFFVTVSNIQYNWQGQTHLEHVNALMVPDQNGTAVDFSGGNTQVVTLNYSLDSTWPVEDVEFVAFLQDATTTKEIFNGIKRGAVDLNAEFTADATQIIKNQVVTYTNGTTGGYIGVPETYSWTFPGGTPASSTDKNPQVTYSQTGTFDVILVVDRGTQIDSIVKQGYITVNSPVGITPVQNSNAIITPNPCSGNFKIAFTGTYDLRILDILGHEVYCASGVEGTRVFTINLPSGTYFASLKSEGRQIVQKLLVR